MSLAVDLLKRSAMRNALALSGLFIVVLTACGLWMVAQISREVRDEIDEQLVLAHQELQSVPLAELRDWFRNEDELVLFTESYRLGTGTVLGAVRADVFDTPGVRTLTAPELFQPRFLTAFDRMIQDWQDEDISLNTESWRVFVAPMGDGQLAVFEPISAVEDALALIPRIVLTVGAAMVATTLLAGALMAWRQQARLDRIRDGIARIGRGDLGHPMAPDRLRDDLDEIMQGIDTAAAQLDGSISRLRLFSQNVAHELRTPLARLRATLEEAPGTPEAALDRTDDIIRTLDAVQRIARLSHQPDPGTLSAVRLGVLATLTEELFADVADDAGQSLVVVVNSPAMVQGDFQLLAQMLSNLVENAIRYAGPGAAITVTAQGAVLSVRDTGPGITTDDDLTEPFARADKSRAGPGSGLGLALVKTIARYHGAELTLTSDHGLEARITFPT